MGSVHGIKVLLSLVSSSDKHLPPHAQDMLSPPERTVATMSAVEMPREASEVLQEREPEQVVLGLSKKDPERKR